MKLQRLAFALWDALVRGSGNIAYRLAFNGLAAVYERCFDATTAVLAEEHRDLESYAAISAAIRARDPESARAAAERLLARGLDALVTLAALLDAPASPATPARGMKGERS